MEKIDFNSSLNELWLCESRLKRIPKLCNCEALQVLYIYGNMISRVENLDHLTRLEFLSLAQNQLTTTRGFEKLAELSDLNIGANDIKCKFLNSTGVVGLAKFQSRWALEGSFEPIRSLYFSHKLIRAQHPPKSSPLERAAVRGLARL
jgi:hypothetical protein